MTLLPLITVSTSVKLTYFLKTQHILTCESYLLERVSDHLLL